MARLQNIRLSVSKGTELIRVPGDMSPIDDPLASELLSKARNEAFRAINLFQGRSLRGTSRGWKARDLGWSAIYDSMRDPNHLLSEIALAELQEFIRGAEDSNSRFMEIDANDFVSNSDKSVLKKQVQTRAAGMLLIVDQAVGHWRKHDFISTINILFALHATRESLFFLLGFHNGPVRYRKAQSRKNAGKIGEARTRIMSRDAEIKKKYLELARRIVHKSGKRIGQPRKNDIAKRLASDLRVPVWTVYRAID